MKGLNVEFSHSNWFVDTKHEFFALSYTRGFTSLGVELVSLYIPATPKTDEDHPFGNGNFFSFGDYLFGVTLSRRITDRFSIGAAFKYLNEVLDDFKSQGFAMDLGAVYSIGYRGMWVGIALSNLGTSVRVEGEGERGGAYLIPSIYRLGLSGYILKPLYTTIQIEKPSDNVESLSIGLEWSPIKLLHLRGGYMFRRGLKGKANLPHGLTLGLGLNLKRGPMKLTLDYGVSGYGYLGDVHRISVGVEGL